MSSLGNANGGDLLEVSVAADLAAFDQLPLELRNLLNYGPGQFGAQDILTAYHNHPDTRQISRRAIQIFRDMFPEWKPLPQPRRLVRYRSPIREVLNARP